MSGLKTEQIESTDLVLKGEAATNGAFIIYDPNGELVNALMGQDGSGNPFIQSASQVGYITKILQTIGSYDNPGFQWRVKLAGIGEPEFALFCFGDNQTERKVAGIETTGTFAAVRDGTKGSLVEGFGADGHTEPNFRINTYHPNFTDFCVFMAGDGDTSPNQVGVGYIGPQTLALMVGPAADTMQPKVLVYADSMVMQSGVNLVLANDPTQPLHAASKQYVDSLGIGAGFSSLSVRCATTANITLSGEQTIDGVTTSQDRVMVKNNTNQAENGLYLSDAGAWTRVSDFDSFSEVPGKLIAVEEGSTQADTLWLSTANSGGTIDVDPITFIENQNALQIQGNGFAIQRSGNVMDLILDGTTLTQTGSGLKVGDAQIDTTQLADQAVTNEKLAETYSRVLSETSVDLSSINTHNLYTVPSGKRVFVERIMVEITSDTSPVGTPEIGVGVQAGEDDIVIQTQLNGLDVTGEFSVLSTDGVARVAQATEVIKLGVDVGLSSGALVANIILIGTEL